jgi:hypothetical protein
VTSVTGGASQLLATNGIGPLWSPDRKALLYSYFRLDSNPIAGRLAELRLGGTERLLSDWRTDYYFHGTDWNTDGLLGTYLAGTLTGDAALVFRPAAHLADAARQRVVASIPNAQLWQGRWSPNRRWVACEVSWNHRPDLGAVMIARADGTPAPT